MKKIILAVIFLTVLLGFGVSAAFAFQTYLPVVNHQATPTPTTNPSPILLPNGDFELGQLIWYEYSNYGYDIIRKIDDLSVSPHGGDWAAWMGGAFDDVDYLSQTVVVPADHPFLSFWFWILSTDDCDNDFAFIYLGSTQIDKHDLCFDHNTYDWVQKVYDLRAYSGQSVNLIISVETNSMHVSSFYLDDFEFQASLNP